MTDKVNVVISVSAFFSHFQRQETIVVGEAGFVVKKIINEPTAAAIAKGINLKERKKTFVVFDFGGGTLDVTVMETGVENGTKTFQVLSTHGDTFLGGVDFDEVIMEMVLEKIRTTFKDEFNEML